MGFSAGVGECELRHADGELKLHVARAASRAFDPMADRAALHRDDLLQAVAPVGRGGEAEEVAGGGAPDGGLERERGQVVALVDHDQAVVGEERFEIVDRLEALDHRKVDDPSASA